MARHQKDQTPDPIYGMLDAILKGIWYVLSLPFKGFGGGKARQAELEKTKAEFRSHWSQLEASLHDPVHRRQAIMSADILLDRALQYHKIPGTSLGERLKSATSRMNRDLLDTAWRAHKVRNRLAHELNYSLSEGEANQAMQDFKKVIREMGLL